MAKASTKKTAPKKAINKAGVKKKTADKLIGNGGKKS